MYFELVVAAVVVLVVVAPAIISAMWVQKQKK